MLVIQFALIKHGVAISQVASVDSRQRKGSIHSVKVFQYRLTKNKNFTKDYTK